LGARPEVTYDSKQQKICLASSRALAFDVAMEPQITNTVPDLPQAFDKLAAGDVTGAVVAVVAATEPGVALDGLGQLCMQAYRELKNIPVMNAIAWEAIKFGLTPVIDPSAKTLRAAIRAVLPRAERPRDGEAARPRAA